MLIVKACWVRLADDRNSHSPIGHGALDVQDADLAVVAHWAILFGPEVDREQAATSVPQCPDRAVLAFAFDRVRRLHDHGHPHATLGGPDQRLANVGDAIDGEADQRDPALARASSTCRIACSVRRNGHFPGIGAGPHQFDDLRIIGGSAPTTPLSAGPRRPCGHPAPVASLRQRSTNSSAKSRW